MMRRRPLCRGRGYGSGDWVRARAGAGLRELEIVAKSERHAACYDMRRHVPLVGELHNDSGWPVSVRLG